MDLKNDEKMMENIARYKKYLTKKDYLAAKIEYKEICRKLKKMFGDKTYEALILYEVNIRALSNYLLNN